MSSVLSDFSKWSGLMPNQIKSNIFMADSDPVYKDAILNIFNFQLGSLPIKYLGLPLITSKLSAADCTPLIDSVLARIKGWTTKSLSFAGRLQLVKSVISSLHVYWASHLILPKSIINRVEQLMRDFLWKGQPQRSGICKVTWRDVAVPQKEGGLDIKRLTEWNEAAMAKYMWKLLQPQSLSI